MKAASLIEDLISVADIAKKDFAKSVSMSASGLSRFLTGQQFPSLTDHQSFSREAAKLLSSVIYEPKCHLRLTARFPCIYDFSSENDLMVFLSSAISYALEYDFAIDHQVDLHYGASELFYYTHRRVLNMTCIILSDLLHQEKNETLEMFSAMPLLFGELPYSLSRIIFTNEHQQRIILNHSLNFEKASLSESYVKMNNPFGKINQLEQDFDLCLWETNYHYKQVYLLLKNHCLLTYDSLPDGTPSLRIIRNKNYLLHFLQFVKKCQIRKLSYNRDEVRQLLRNEPSLAMSLIKREPQALYSFIPLSYYLSPDETAGIEESQEQRELMHCFLAALMNTDACFFPSGASIGEFARSGKTIVPFSGSLHISKEERIKMMHRLVSRIGPQMLEKTKVIYTSMSNAAILCTKDLTLLYMISPDDSSEKIHLFFLPNVAEYLEQDFHNKQFRLLEYTPALWQSYIDEIRNRLK
ncbi:MAG TPA: hypothetical protein GXZ59_04765 [Clostridiaceae bacterium]|nr:hypothetical protein [Clostridiaceae bacterium]